VRPPSASELTGTLQGWDFSISRPNLGAPWARITVWPDRLEINSPLFNSTTVIPRDRVLRVRLLSLRHPVQRVFLKGFGRQYVNIVIAHPHGAAYPGNIHYVLGVRDAIPVRILEMFQYYGYPVGWDPKIIKSFSVYPDLSLDRLRE
jgi:hypothetical protein